MKLTVQGWQNLVLAVLGTAVLGCSIAATILVGQADQVSNQLRDGVQPARVAAYQLQAALRDQETAVRGYLLTADPRFLDPYHDGRASETAAAEQIRQDLAGSDELLTDLDRIEAAAEQWRDEYAGPLVAGIVGAEQLDDASINEGRALFDRLRELFTVQNDHLTEARAAGLIELDEIRGWRDAVMIAMILTFVVTAVLLAVVMHNAVTRPLSVYTDGAVDLNDGAGRGMPADHRGQLRRTHHSARAHRYPRHRRRRGGHAPAHRRRAGDLPVRAGRPRRTGRRIAPLQCRARAVRLCRVA